MLISPLPPISYQNHARITHEHIGTHARSHVHTHMVGFVVNKVDFSEVPGVVPDMRGKEPNDFFHRMFDIYQETTRHAEDFIRQNKQYLSDHPTARAHD